ncbi:MAG TPA: alpha/beta hydrolase [Ramlibacter sp.]|nr:alpha/beta hydrolase [Ramlibacter sp.]
MQTYSSVWTHLFRTAFRHDWVDAGGVRTRFLEAGQKGRPVVLFLHGTGGSLEAFCANIAAHAEHFHCFAIDLVGSGQSDKPDLDYEIPVYARQACDFLDAMRVEQASLCGVSLGAWVCARFALRYPERARKLTLLSAAGLVANPNTMKQIRSLRSSAVDDPSWDNIRAVMENLVHRKEALIDDLVAVRQAIYRQDGMRQAMAHTLCLQAPEIRARNLLSEAEWRRITAPALVVGALEDNPDYLGTARAVADFMPNARYVEMPEVAHWPQFEASDTFNRLNIEFLLS